MAAKQWRQHLPQSGQLPNWDLQRPRGNLEGLPSQGLSGIVHGAILVVEPTLTGIGPGIGPGIEQPPSRLSAESQAKALLKMQCPPSGSFWLLFARWKVVWKVVWKVGGKFQTCPVLVGYRRKLRVCGWKSDYRNCRWKLPRLLDIVPCMNRTQRGPCLCSFPSFLPSDHGMVMALATAQAWRMRLD